MLLSCLFFHFLLIPLPMKFTFLFLEFSHELLFTCFVWPSPQKTTVWGSTFALLESSIFPRYFFGRKSGVAALRSRRNMKSSVSPSRVAGSGKASPPQQQQDGQQQQPSPDKKRAVRDTFKLGTDDIMRARTRLLHPDYTIEGPVSPERRSDKNSDISPEYEGVQVPHWRTLLYDSLYRAEEEAAREARLKYPWAGQSAAAGGTVGAPTALASVAPQLPDDAALLLNNQDAGAKADLDSAELEAGDQGPNVAASLPLAATSDAAAPLQPNVDAT